jgi:hypothetical protein
MKSGQDNWATKWKLWITGRWFHIVFRETHFILLQNARRWDSRCDLSGWLRNRRRIFKAWSQSALRKDSFVFGTGIISVGRPDIFFYDYFSRKQFVNVSTELAFSPAFM